MNYSQNEEQGVINSLFGDKGRFLDVGAFDGRTFSNTFKLFERGWNGVLVEPSPNAYAGLQRQYQGNKRAVLIKAAVAEKSGQIVFYDSGGDAISSTETAHKDKWEKGYNCKFNKIEVKAITFDNIFKRQGSFFDFVNIDTEGTNLKMLELFPFDVCLPLCMCIEHDSEFEKMGAIFKQHGYKEVYRSGENLIMYRGE